MYGHDGHGWMDGSGQEGAASSCSAHLLAGLDVAQQLRRGRQRRLLAGGQGACGAAGQQGSRMRAGWRRGGLGASAPLRLTWLHLSTSQGLHLCHAAAGQRHASKGTAEAAGLQSTTEAAEAAGTVVPSKWHCTASSAKLVRNWPAALLVLECSVSQRSWWHAAAALLPGCSRRLSRAPPTC